MAWIELHQSLVSSRKLLRLKEELGIPKAQAAGHLCFLWLWALDNCPTGDLSGIPPKLLAEAADFSTRKAGAFLEALVLSGFLDREGESLRIHDWMDYAGRLKEIRDRNSERKRRYREKQRDRDVSVPEKNGTVPGLPDQTKPDQTKPDQTKPDQIDHFSDADEGARADAQRMDDYLLERGLLPQGSLGSTPELIGQSRALTEELFRRFCSRKPTEADYAQVFPLVCPGEVGPDGQFVRHWDGDYADLLRYAFEKAALRGCGGVWPFIEGVLLRLHQRDIHSLAEAERYDLGREEWK